MNGHKTNECMQRMNEPTILLMNERTNPTIERAKCQPNKRKMDQLHEQTPENPATQEITEIHLFLFETKEKTLDQFGVEETRSVSERIEIKFVDYLLLTFLHLLVSSPKV